MEHNRAILNLKWLGISVQKSKKLGAIKGRVDDKIKKAALKKTT